MSGISERVKVMVVDDSALVRKYASRLLSELGMEVVATASDGRIALQKMYLYSPDIIILDIEMPEMNGLEFLKYIKQNPPPHKPSVIVFSSLVEDGSQISIEALNNGAIDLIKKPEVDISRSLDSLKTEFKLKIEGIYFGLKEKEIKDKKDFENKTSLTPYGMKAFTEIFKSRMFHPKIISVGSSTGGTIALRQIIGRLGELPVPMIVAQHMPEGFTEGFAKNLKDSFHREIKEASDNEILKNGVIYICPGGKHARIEKVGDKLIYREDREEYTGFYFKPSVDILFASLRESVGENVLAIILSGMGKDGAIESVNLRKKGAFVVAQSKESSVVWGMPGNAVKNGGVDVILDIDEIADMINLISKTAG